MIDLEYTGSELIPYSRQNKVVTFHKLVRFIIKCMNAEFTEPFYPRQLSQEGRRGTLAPPERLDSTMASFQFALL